MRKRTEKQKEAAALARELKPLKNISRRWARLARSKMQDDLKNVRQWCRSNTVHRLAKRNTCAAERIVEAQTARARAAVECAVKKNSMGCKTARLDASEAAKNKRVCAIESRAQLQADRHSCDSAKRTSRRPYDDAMAEYVALRQKEQSALAQAGYAVNRAKENRAQAADEVRANLEAVDARLIPVFNKRRRHYKGTGEHVTELFLQDMHDEGWFDGSGDLYQATLDEAQRQGERDAERVLGVKRGKGKRKKNLAPVPF